MSDPTPDELDALADAIDRLRHLADMYQNTNVGRDAWIALEHLAPLVEREAARLRAEARPVDPRGSGSGGTSVDKYRRAAVDDGETQHEHTAIAWLFDHVGGYTQGQVASLAAALAQARREALEEAAARILVEGDGVTWGPAMISEWLRARAAEIK